MEQDKKIPSDIKNIAIDTATDVLKDYSKTKPVTGAGKLFRKISNVLGRLLPIMKYIKLNQK